MNSVKNTKINYLITQMKFCSRWVFQRLTSKELVSDFIKNKDYEITSRDTRDFS